MLPWSIDHLHVGHWLCVATILDPPQTPSYCGISRSWFGNCSLWCPLQLLEDHMVMSWSSVHVSIWFWMCIRWMFTLNRDLLAATLIFALSSTFSSSDKKIMKDNCLLTSGFKHHQVCSHVLGTCIWTYLQCSAAEMDSHKSCKYNHVKQIQQEVISGGVISSTYLIPGALQRWWVGS